MQSSSSPSGDIAQLALREFDALVERLLAAGVEVLVDEEPDLPDSVFPNNWVSYHQPSGRSPVVVTYPMATPLRRKERRLDVITRIQALSRGETERIELESLEQESEILEGTGALVLDRVAGVAFACRSPRATDSALRRWQEISGFELISFDAFDETGLPIYHTNVLLSIGTRLAVFVPGSVTDVLQRRAIEDRLARLGKEIVSLTMDQMNEMCANVLELESTSGHPVIAMSSRAWAGFNQSQRDSIQAVAEVVCAPIPTIEAVGGGSVRCMIAELGRRPL